MMIKIKHIYFLILGVFILGLVPSISAHAQSCSTERETRYISSGMMQVCNGSQWRNMTSTLLNYSCDNGNWVPGSTCSSASSACTSGLGGIHGVTTLCCTEAPTVSCNGEFRQYVCNCDGNWSSTSNYYTASSGNCTSTGSYTSPDSVRCSIDTYPSGPNANGCDATGCGRIIECDDGGSGNWTLTFTGCSGHTCNGTHYPGDQCCDDGGTLGDCVSTCFIPGTQISMPDGSTKNIEDIALGEVIVTSSGDYATTKANSKDYDGPIYGFNDGEPFFTPNHPFMTLEGWKALDPKTAHIETGGEHVTLLEVGDTVIKQDGTHIKIEAFSEKPYKGKVYYLGVETSDTKDYYANDYWVHNAVIAK